MAGEVSFKSKGLELLLWHVGSSFFRKSERMLNLHGKVEPDAIQSSSTTIQVYVFQIYASNPLKKALKLSFSSLQPVFERLRERRQAQSQRERELAW